MFPDDPRIIYDISDLKEIGEQMKISANPDDPLGNYSKTEEQAARRKKCEGMSEEEMQFYRTHGGNRAIGLNGHLISLVMTTDDYHGHQWHFSMVEVTGPSQFAVVPDDLGRIVLGAFFSQWESVENPGKFLEVKHFVGDD